MQFFFSSQFDALAFWKYKNSGKKRWGNDFLSGRLFSRRWNWEEKSSTIYHCTVFGGIIKSVLPFVLQRIWFKYFRLHITLVQMFWSWWVMKIVTLPRSSTSPKTDLDYDDQNYSIWFKLEYTNQRLFIESCPKGSCLVQKGLGKSKIVFDL